MTSATREDFQTIKIIKSFQVSLTKSYLVNINAENQEDAKRLAEFFTGNIQDISNQNNRSVKRKSYITHLTRRDEQGSFPAEFGKLIVKH